MSNSEDVPIQNRLWDGQFADLDDALANLGNESQDGLFAHPAWLARQINLWSTIAMEPQTLDELLSRRRTNLPLVICGLITPSVIDLGGGSGWCYRSSIRAGAQPSSYTIVELSSVVEACSSIQGEGLHWTTMEDFHVPVNAVDVLYVNSALQYMPNNEELLDLAESCRPTFILLDELAWTRNESDWFTVQVNSDTPVAYRFAAIEPLLEELRTRGFAPSWADVVPGAPGFGFPDMSGLDPAFRVPGFLSLLCKRV